MMYHSKYQLGFSLIELIVVLAIMGTVMGLTGGLVTKAIGQQQRQIELEKVKQLFKQLSYKAYYSGTSTTVTLKNNIMIIKGASIQELYFEQLTFVAGSYVVSSFATITPNEYGVFISGKPLYFELPQLLKPYEKN